MAQFTPYFIQLLFGFLSRFFPFFIKTNPCRIVLTSFHGDGYRGNTRILFEELCLHPQFEPVWLSRNKKVVAFVRETFGRHRGEFQHSFTGLKKLAEAGCILFTHGTSDFPFLYLPRTALRIQTYHGLPTKRGEYLRPNSHKEPGWFHKKILEYRFKPVTHFLTSSPMVTEIFSKRFRIPEKRFLKTGYPIYDKLMDLPDFKTNLKQRFPELPESEYLILYAPTYRKLTKTRWFPFDDFDPKRLAEFLEENKMVIAMRPHPNDQLPVKDFKKHSNRIIFVDHTIAEDVSEILPFVSGILTDYSSIYLEGLLLDIPVIFIPYDLQSYERGLALPYEKMTPGPQVSLLRELLDCLSDLTKGKEAFSAKRSEIKDQFFSYQDNHSTENVIQFLEKNLISGTDLIDTSNQDG